MLSILLGFLMINIVFLAHELGHILALRKRNIEIEEIGLGYQLPYVPALSVNLFGWKFTIHPLLIGAYVGMSEKGLVDRIKLPFREDIAICRAGIAANLYLSLALIPVYLIVSGKIIALVHILSFFQAVKWMFIIAGVIAGFKIILLIFETLPLVATKSFFFALLAYSVIVRPVRPMHGILALGDLGSLIIDFPNFLLLTALFSFFIAVLNMLPFSMLDGGKIIMLKKISRDGFIVVSRFERALDWGFLFLVIKDFIL